MELYDRGERQINLSLVRIVGVEPLQECRVELTLSTGEMVQRDLRPLLQGAVFEPILANESKFREVRAEQGTLVWPGDVELCPDTIIWGGLPPEDSATQAA